MSKLPASWCEAVLLAACAVDEAEEVDDVVVETFDIALMPVLIALEVVLIALVLDHTIAFTRGCRRHCRGRRAHRLASRRPVADRRRE